MKTIICLPHKFNEMGVVKILRKFKAKMKNQWKKCVCVGYVVRHAIGTYHLIHPTTERYVSTRGMIILKKTYGEWSHEKMSLMLP